MPLNESDLFTKPCLLDYDACMLRVDRLEKLYPFIRVGCLGNSILGRAIPLITIGSGERSCLYVATHHAMEWITSLVLLRFVNEFCEDIKHNLRIGSIFPHYIARVYTIYVVPMLNPDGVDYQINGVSEDNILRERLISMNNGSLDFSCWQSNARGVDLNRNYNSRYAEYKQLENEMGIMGGASVRFSGEMPESEPEVGALCNFLRFNRNIQAVLTLHSQGEEIYYTSGDKTAPRSRAIGERLAKMSGYSLSR